jgi:acetylornithine/succinyldiaminopimelate/putrescine aminotransferase
MQGLRALCDERKIALICDEVWTAPARTGKWFAYQHYGIEPDIMTLGKATGGGAPVAAAVVKPALAEVMVPGTHGCTLGGAPLCAAAGAAVMRLIESEDLVAAADAKGKAIVEAIELAGLDRIKTVRGKGLMVGIELDGPGKEVFARCLEKGLIINCTQETVLRLAPPLTLTDSDLAEGLDILLDVLRE